VNGPLGAAVCAAFDDMDVRIETVLTGELCDDAALHGLLARVRDLGLQVTDLRVSSDEPAERSSS